MSGDMETCGHKGNQQPDQDFEKQLGYTMLLSLGAGTGIAGGSILASEGHPWLGTAVMIGPLLTTVASRGLTRSFLADKKER
jgi:hypothetical protein